MADYLIIGGGFVVISLFAWWGRIDDARRPFRPLMKPKHLVEIASALAKLRATAATEEDPPPFVSTAGAEIRYTMRGEADAPHIHLVSLVVTIEGKPVMHEVVGQLLVYLTDLLAFPEELTRLTQARHQVFALCLLVADDHAAHMAREIPALDEASAAARFAGARKALRRREWFDHPGEN